MRDAEGLWETDWLVVRVGLRDLEFEEEAIQVLLCDEEIDRLGWVRDKEKVEVTVIDRELLGENILVDVALRDGDGVTENERLSELERLSVGVRDPLLVIEDETVCVAVREVEGLLVWVVVGSGVIEREPDGVGVTERVPNAELVNGRCAHLRWVPIPNERCII